MSDIEKYEKRKRLLRVPLWILHICLVLCIIQIIWSREVRLSTVLIPFAWLALMTSYSIICCKVEMLRKIESLGNRCSNNELD